MTRIRPSPSVSRVDASSLHPDRLRLFAQPPPAGVESQRVPRAERRGGRAPEAPSWPIRAVPGPDGDAPWRVVWSGTFFIFLFAKIASWSEI